MLMQSRMAWIVPGLVAALGGLAALIAKEKLEPGVDEVVPNSIVTLAELVSKGYEIIKY